MWFLNFYWKVDVNISFDYQKSASILICLAFIASIPSYTETYFSEIELWPVLKNSVLF